MMQNMRWSGIGLACVLAFGVQSALAENSPLELKGNLRLRAETSDRTDLSGLKNAMLLRARTGLSFKPRSDFQVFLEPQFAKAFGQLTYSGTSATGNGANQTSGSTFDDSFSVHQAYLSYQPWSDRFSLIAGRQVLSYGDELVIGALDWNNVGRSFDAVKLRWTCERGSTDLFWSKLVDMNISGPADGDYDFYGLYNAWNFGEHLKEFDLYALYLRDARGRGPLVQSLWTFGTRLKSQLGSLDYRVEGDYQNGMSLGRGTSEYQADGELGFQLMEESRTRLSLGGFLASKEYQQLFPTVHKWLGIADIFGRRNIWGGVVKASTQVGKNLTLMVDGMQFFRTSTDVTAFKTSGASLSSTTRPGTGSASSSLGMEFDVQAKVALNDSLSWLSGYALMLPGEYIKDNFGSDLPMFYFTQLSASF